MAEEVSGARLVERSVLEKFEGDPVPENLFERIYIEDGSIVRVEVIRDGEVVTTRKRDE